MPEPAAKPAVRAASATLIGMALWVAATLCETVMVGCVRIVSNDLHPLQVVFLRVFCGLVVLLPWIVRLGPAGLRTSVFPQHVLRAALQLVGMVLWFASVPLVILADVAALSFLAPLFATAGAIALLGERVGWRRGLALLIGFGGVLVIVRPGSDFNLGWGLLIVAAAFWASALLVIKRMARTETSPCMTAWATILIAPALAIPAFLVWRDPSWVQWGLMLAAGTAGTVTHLLMGQAFRYADASSVMPMDFFRMIWITLLGYLLFSEVPSWHVWVGASLIFAAALYVTLREANLARQARRLQRNA